MVDTTPPSTPAGFSAAPTLSGLRLQWQPATDDVRVRYYVVKRDGAQIAWPGVCYYLDTNVVSRVLYRYELFAVDDAGNHSLPATCNAMWPVH